jgi:hypothetical protein
VNIWNRTEAVYARPPELVAVMFDAKRTVPPCVTWIPKFRMGRLALTAVQVIVAVTVCPIL